MKKKNNCRKCGAVKSKFATCKCSRGYARFEKSTLTPFQGIRDQLFIATLDAFGAPIFTKLYIPNGSSPFTNNPHY